MSAFLSRGHSATEVAVDTGAEAKESADTYLELMRRLLVDKSISEEDEATMLAQLADGDAAKRKIVEKAVNLHAIAKFVFFFSLHHLTLYQLAAEYFS